MNWHRFLADYDSYKGGGAPDSRLEEPWLLFLEGSGCGKPLEANVSDKTSFFVLMEALRIPLEFFKPQSGEET